jgi:hypothetical protein
MQRLESSGAVRHVYMSLGVKGIIQRMRIACRNRHILRICSNYCLSTTTVAKLRRLNVIYIFCLFVHEFNKEVHEYESPTLGVPAKLCFLILQIC